MKEGGTRARVVGNSVRDKYKSRGKILVADLNCAWNKEEEVLDVGMNYFKLRRT